MVTKIIDLVSGTSRHAIMGGDEPAVRYMAISERTFQRLKNNSGWYGDSESYEEIIIRLLDSYEKNNGPSYHYD